MIMACKVFSVGTPLAILLWLAPVLPNASADIVEYSAGHADIGVEYEAGSGELEPHWHFGTSAVLNEDSGNDIEYEPGGAYARVPDASKLSRPSGAQWDFTGAGAGDDIWLLSQNNIAGQPFLGFAAEEVGAASDWTGDISWALDSVSGPSGAHFSVWQSSFSTTPLMSTADPASNPGFTTSIGGHGHFNLGFTEEGVYDVTWTASGTHNTDGFVSGTGTFKFVVGSATAVPEAGTASLLALGSLGLLVGGFHQRRRRGTSPQTTA